MAKHILIIFLILTYPVFSKTDTDLEKQFLYALELDWNNNDSLALEYYKKILLDEPEYYKVYSAISGQFSSPKNQIKGIEFFNSLLKSKSSNGYAYYGLARISRHQKNYEQALFYLNQCRALKPNFSHIYGPYGGLGDLYERMGNYDLAIKFYKRALTKKNYFKWFYIETSQRLYKIYEKLGRANEAEEIKSYLIDNMNELLANFESEPQIAARRFHKLNKMIHLYHNFDEILAGYKASCIYLSLAKKQNNQENIEFAYSLVGTFKLYLGEYKQSLELFTKIIEVHGAKYSDSQPLQILAAIFAG